MSFPGVVFINSVALRLAYFFNQCCLWDSKEQQGPLRLFLSLGRWKQHSFHQYILLCCRKFNVFSFSCRTCFSTLSLIASTQYDIFVKLTSQNGKILPMKAGRIAFNFYMRGFLFSTLPTYLGSSICLHPCPVKLTTGGRMLSRLHSCLHLKWCFHNMRLKVYAIALEQRGTVGTLLTVAIKRGVMG